ncbi:MAG TPA: DUF4160 domain-containing protein [Elusimicrobia bacterium]|nr:MAG: hypothetical protein A2278_05870 [Elusimicrobia bacterium RIFOXYA12_FULL_49_49]OGS09577.1 MAG: hypothetical protein A2386_07445 [Elusimicrobia bacterium RIFOXYB1_FULL_48_9]OGS15434.1 MAG: hypothetical protein A2251_07700 [Elusimicrobia bacterium RIFOXYA2_FULL_47_53]HBU69149.1 DUF4160 domain-containing protein [Elusimicrobiota bacterium]
MSPTVFRKGEYRFFFFSREEKRLHVHVQSSKGEAKFWIDPIVSLAENYGLSARELLKIQEIVKEHESEIRSSWKKHFRR